MVVLFSNDYDDYYMCNSFTCELVHQEVLVAVGLCLPIRHETATRLYGRAGCKMRM